MESRNFLDNHIEKLYREMYSVLHGHAKNVLGESLLAEEAVQDTFCIACAKRDELMESANPQGWLMEALKFVIMSTQRRQARLGKLEALSLSSEESSLLASYDEGDIDLLYENLAAQKDFQLLKKIELEHYTMREAAEELGISVEACKKRVQRIRKFLRENFSEDGN